MFPPKADQPKAEANFKIINNKQDPRPNFASILQQDASPLRDGPIRPTHLANVLQNILISLFYLASTGKIRAGSYLLPPSPTFTNYVIFIYTNFNYLLACN